MSEPYYEDDAVTIYHGDCRDILPMFPEATLVSDPPFNIAYHYDTYHDNMTSAEYEGLLAAALRPPCAVIHYPEQMFVVARLLAVDPSEVAAWVYNANTPKQFRLVAWFGISPNFAADIQPYKNPSDKRIARRISAGALGTPVYDWWHIEQVKNTSLEKTTHPCQMPLSVMQRIVRVTPGDLLIDPFMGSGTTLRAAKDQGRHAVGVDIDERYCELAAQRCSQDVLPLFAEQSQGKP